MYNYSLLERLLFMPTRSNKQQLKTALQRKTILITGASSGIGEQVAYLLADINVQLILVARREDRLLSIQQDIEKQAATVSVYKADLRNEEEVNGLLTFIDQLPNGLDIVVSNAGLSINRSIHESLGRYHDFTRTMAINYFAPVQLLLSVIPLLIKNKGQIINVSTINVLLLPLPKWAAYQASKSAFDTWFRSTAPELNADGISTTSIYLPLVKTDMIRPTAAYDDVPTMSPEHVAHIICKSMYTLKRTYRPWWIRFGQLGSILFRGVWEVSMPRVLRRKEGGKR